MFGINSEMIGLLTNKQKLAEKIKSEAPPLLDQLLQLIQHQCGAPEGQPVACVFYTAKLGNGSTARMVRVHAVDAFGDITGEPYGTLNVAEALQAVPNETITQLLPW